MLLSNGGKFFIWTLYIQIESKFNNVKTGHSTHKSENEKLIML